MRLILPFEETKRHDVLFSDQFDASDCWLQEGFRKKTVMECATLQRETSQGLICAFNRQTEDQHVCSTELLLSGNFLSCPYLSHR